MDEPRLLFVNTGFLYVLGAVWLIIGAAIIVCGAYWEKNRIMKMKGFATLFLGVFVIIFKFALLPYFT